MAYLNLIPVPVLWLGSGVLLMITCVGLILSLGREKYLRMVRTLEKFRDAGVITQFDWHIDHENPRATEVETLSMSGGSSALEYEWTVHKAPDTELNMYGPVPAEISAIVRVWQADLHTARICLDLLEARDQRRPQKLFVNTDTLWRQAEQRTRT